MARRQDVQSADGVVSYLAPFGILHCVRSTAPVNLKPGFAKGCLYQYLGDSAGAGFYVNVGDHGATGSAWVSAGALAAGGPPRPVAATAITTNGAGTLTGAAVVGGVILRSGPNASGFTDTTDTGTLIQAAIGSYAYAGMSWLLFYRNASNQTATIAAGSGVTVSNVTTVVTNTTAIYLVTLTATNTVTMVGIANGIAYQ
jgi:hypothetical protein